MATSQNYECGSCACSLSRHLLGCPKLSHESRPIFDLHFLGRFHILWELVKVEVPVCLRRISVNLLGVLLVLRRGGKFSQHGRNSSKLCGGEVHIGTLAKAVGKVAGRCGHHRGLVAYACLVPHAQRASRHLQSRPDLAEDTVIAFCGQLSGIHLGWRSHPQASGKLAIRILFQELARSAEMPDVGHAGADKYFVDLVPSHVRQQTGIVRVIGSAKDGFCDFVHVDVDRGGVLRAWVSLQQLGLLKPQLHVGDAALDGPLVTVALVKHPLQHHNVRGNVLLDRLGVKLDGTPGGGSLSGRVGQFERLLALELLEALNLQDAAGEDVLLPLLLHRQHSLLDGVVGDGVHEVAQRDSRLHLPREAHQHRLRHVQGHHTGGRSKCHKTRPCGEGDADGEARVGVPPSAHGVGQKHAVEPGVNHAISGAQRHPAAVAYKVRQRVVSHDVHRLGVGGSVAEGLHHQVG
mmetsp:Transcript_44158/g.84388  ORF Transcript_44158/g.84388 Transcript_44158/m.84388 type:complete len:463 (-) Transcript_44158:1563-2951(-)